MALTDGLVGRWHPTTDNTGNGTTTLYDQAGSNNGTLTNMDAATDWVADTADGGVRALDFDGSNDYVKAIVNPVSYPFSMAGWVNVTTSSVVRAFLVQEAGSQSNTFGGYIQNGVFVLQAYNGSANSQTTTNVSILNNWHHIVTVFTSSTSRTVYIDGILRATASDSVPVLVAPTRVLIGCNNESNQFFSGLIDTVLLYDRVLTSAEITLLAASRNPFATGPEIRRQQRSQQIIS